MSGFVNRIKTDNTVNPAGGVDLAKTPNVGQYGWTSYDASNVNQIIQYVDLCKKYAEVAAGGAEYVESKYSELEKFMKYIEQVYETINPIYLGIEQIQTDIVKRHEDIKIRHEDIISRHDEIQTWHYEVNVMTEETEANAAKALTSQLLAGQSEQGAESWYNKSYELYDDLRKGNIYRGTWNPHTGAYPNNGGTNSTWDVILNEGELEFRWDNILWFWGDRLVYLKEENKYQQIESGTTVTSVNGKKGAVVLSAEDVQAVPITRTVNGKALSANISITSTDTNSVPTTRRVNNKALDADVVLTHADVHAVPLDRKINNKFLNADITLNADDVGAAPSGYGLGEAGAFTVGDLDSDPLTWNGGKIGWFRGISSTLNRPDGRSGVGIMQRYQKEGSTSGVHILYMAGSDIYTRYWTGTEWMVWGKNYSDTNKPTAADVGAIPITGGTLTGPLTIKGSSYQALALDSTDAAGCVIKGRKGGVDDWYVGRGNSAGDVVFHSYKHSTSLVMKSDSINFNRDLYVNTNKVYHQGFKPTTADVGATINAGASTADCNTHLYPGHYNISGGSPNWAFGDQGGAMYVFSHGDKYITQLAAHGATNELAIRTKNVSTWSGWKRIYNEDFKPTAADVGALPLSGGTVSGVIAISEASTSSRQFEVKQGAVTGVFRLSDATAILGTQDNGKWTGAIKVGKSDFVYTPNASTWYKVYHQGFKPTAYDIQVDNPKTKMGATLFDVIQNLKEELELLKSELNETKEKLNEFILK